MAQGRTKHFQGHLHMFHAWVTRSSAVPPLQTELSSTQCLSIDDHRGPGHWSHQQISDRRGVDHLVAVRCILDLLPAPRRWPRWLRSVPFSSGCWEVWKDETSAMHMITYEAYIGIYTVSDAVTSKRCGFASLVVGVLVSRITTGKAA